MKHKKEIEQMLITLKLENKLRREQGLKPLTFKQFFKN